jgi:acyl transferase domain-containing protein/glutamate-1-semialdehyde aminotransferase
MVNTSNSSAISLLEIEKILIHSLALTLGKRESEFTPDSRFQILGIESLQATQIIALVGEKLGTPLSPALFYHCQTVRSLAETLLNPNFVSSEDPSGAPSDLQRSKKQTPVSIIGISARFPGAPNVSTFWNLLAEGRSGIQSIPVNRPELNSGSNPDEKSIQRGGFIEHDDCFDSEAFGIQDFEARKMDPQQRILIEETWKALENANLHPASLKGSKTGVFLGISSNDYTLLRQHGEGKSPTTNVFDATGNAHSIGANRLSYLFDWHGPSMALDTACSSSLVALHQATQSLSNGDCDLAIVAGVNLIYAPEITQAFFEAGMLSPEGECKTFSSDANGYVRGEGVGVIVIRRTEDAKASGNRIYANIVGSATNQDGATLGLTAPNGRAQIEVIRQALKNADLHSQELQWIEAHGTGTALGDPIEFQAIDAVFSPQRSDPFFVGSVKTNIGHLEAAAGIAGVIKTALSLQARTLPASLNFKNLNPRILPSTEFIKVANTPVNFPGNTPRNFLRAGISSFGFGGTNAHVILESADTMPAAAAFNSELENAPWALAFSASQPSALKETAGNWIEFLRRGDVPETALKAATLQSFSTRTELKEIVLFLADSRENLIAKLLAFLTAGASPDFECSKRKTVGGNVAFLYTGQGSQWKKMGKELYFSWEEFRAPFDRCIDGFNRLFKADLFGIIFSESDPEGETLLYQTDYGQAALFSIEYALTFALDKKFHLRAKTLLGHSLGDIVSACVSESITLEEAIRLVAVRGKFMQQTVPGKMWSVFSSPDTVTQLLEERAPQLLSEIDIAALNGPENTVYSIADPASTQFGEFLKESGLKHRALRADRAFHSRTLDEKLPHFRSVAEKIELKAPTTTWISSYTGEVVAPNPSGEYWSKQVRSPTNFSKALESLEKENVQVIVEIGPHPTLIPLVPGVLPQFNSRALVPTLRRGESALESMLKMWIQLRSLGIPLKNPFGTESTIPLPSTVFQKTKFWFRERETPLPHQPYPLKSEVLPMQNHSATTATIPSVLPELHLLVSKLLQISPAELNVDESLFDIGADSLVLLNAVQTVKECYGVSIQISDVLRELTTLRKIAAFINANIDAKRSPGKNTSSELIPTSSPARENTPPLNQNLQAKGVLGNFRETYQEGSSLAPSLNTTDEVSEQNLKNFIQAFNTRTSKSKSHAQTFRQPLADNRVSAGFRMKTKDVVYPIVFKKAKGSRITDIDENEYIDLTMGFGVNLFGHNPDFIQTAIEQQLKEGFAVGPQSELAGPVAEKFCRLTGMERVAFCNSGTEAVMTAMRLARAATKRNKIVLFNGSYHGHFDGVLARPSSHTGNQIPVAPGIPASLVGDVIVLEYGDPKALEVIRNQSSEIAAVVVESVQSRFPEYQPKAFLQELRHLTRQTHSALIFDEVITGFRVGARGAQGFFGVKADLAAYGKILGGGLPIGAVAGEARYLDFIDGGFWEFGDESYPRNDLTFFAGTFCKHPLAMAASNAVLDRFLRDGDSFTQTLTSKTNEFVKKINVLTAERNLDLQMNSFSSLFRFKGNLNLDPLFHMLVHKGIYIWEGRNLFLSTAHTDADLEILTRTVESTLDELLEMRLLKAKSPTLTTPKNVTPAPQGTPLTSPQKRFLELAKKSERGEQATHICLAVKMKGELDTDTLKQSVQDLVNTYDAFRVRVDLGHESQTVIPKTGDVPFEWLSGDFREAKNPWKELDRVLAAESERKIDLVNETPIRFGLYRTSTDTHVLSVICSHFVIDGWSLAQFFEELAKVYLARKDGQTHTIKNGIAFENYVKAISERERERGLLPKESDYWNQKFALAENPAFRWSEKEGWGTSSPQANHDGRRFVFEITSSIYQKIKARSKELRRQPILLLIAGLSRTLMKIQNSPELILSVPGASRDTEGSEEMVGQCATLFPILLKPSHAQSGIDLIQHVREELKGSLSQMSEMNEKMIRSPNHWMTINVEPAAELPSMGEVSLFLYAFPIKAVENPWTLNLTDLEYYYHAEIDYQTRFFSEVDVLKFSRLFSSEINTFMDQLGIEIEAAKKAAEGPSKPSLENGSNASTPVAQ